MCAYGLLIELLQSLVPHRLADPVDVMFNVAGIGVGWWLARTALGGWCETLESWIGAGRAA
jgi:VanZ family protein